MAEKQVELERKGGPVTRREPLQRSASPFHMLQRFADEMDRVFDDFGFGRSSLMPRMRGRWLEPWRELGTEWEEWTPAIDVLHRDNELVVRADLPGLTKDDIKVDVTEDGIIIQGERKREQKEEREGVYRSERSYGSFTRVIPLPEGTMTDQAKATFKDGVLEVTMPAPPDQVRRGRRLEITESAAAKK